jgi:hypothetical protein
VAGLFAAVFSVSSFPNPQNAPKAPVAPVQKLGAAAQKSKTPDQVPLGTLLAKGPPPTVGIFGTGDVIGFIDPCG